jgi:hypothetical protein
MYGNARWMSESCGKTSIDDNATMIQGQGRSE